MKRNARQLHHLKSTRVKVGKGAPSPSEGSSGDLTLRMTNTGVKLFAKFANRWYLVGGDNLSESAGENHDITIDRNKRKKELKINSSEGTVESSKKLTLKGDVGKQTGSAFIELDTKASIHAVSDINITSFGEISLFPKSTGIVNISGTIVNGPDLIIDHTGTSTVGGTLIFRHSKSTTPANNDDPGNILFQGYNNNEEIMTWAAINNEVVNVADSSETGKLTLTVKAVDLAQNNGLVLTGVSSGRVDATIGNGAASVTTVAGDLDIDGDTITSAGALEIDAGGAVTITGQALKIDAGRKLYFDGSTGTYIWESTDDKMELVVGGDKMLTLDEANDKITMGATNWVAGTVSGATITEFSAANSAYAGMILGYTALGIDASDASYTTTTSMAVPHASFQITFVAPPSGKVEIFVSVFVDTSTGRPLVFGLSDNSTYSPIDFPNADDVTNEHEVYMGDETDEEQVNHQWVVEGLTAGTSYTWYFGVKSAPTAGAYVLRWGGTASGEYAPFIMKATALPATIYDGT